MKKKGAALLVVIIIMMLTFFLAAIMIQASIKNLNGSNNSKDSTNAYYCAESGIYDAINYTKLLASSGTLTSSYYTHSIAVNNLYSKGENVVNTNNYLFGDSSATYTASIRLISIDNDLMTDAKGHIVSTPLITKTYNCEIDSEGTYNNQNYIINDTISIFYNGLSWKYSYKSKLSSKN